MLSEMNGVYIRVYLNPKTTTSELPIARFYRYVLTKSIEFNVDGYGPPCLHAELVPSKTH